MTSHIDQWLIKGQKWGEIGYRISKKIAIKRSFSSYSYRISFKLYVLRVNLFINVIHLTLICFVLTDRLISHRNMLVSMPDISWKNMKLMWNICFTFIITKKLFARFLHSFSDFWFGGPLWSIKRKNFVCQFFFTP